MMKTRLQQKHEAFKAQATHTNYEGQLFKYSGGIFGFLKCFPSGMETFLVSQCGAK